VRTFPNELSDEHSEAASARAELGAVAERADPSFALAPEGT
jgi:hypothetical protein